MHRQSCSQGDKSPPPVPGFHPFNQSSLLWSILIQMCHPHWLLSCLSLVLKPIGAVSLTPHPILLWTSLEPGSTQWREEPFESPCDSNSLVNIRHIFRGAVSDVFLFLSGVHSESFITLFFLDKSALLLMSFPLSILPFGFVRLALVYALCPNETQLVL